MYSTFDVRITVVARGASSARERAGDEVHFVARRAGDEEVGVPRARLRDRPPARAVRLDRADVEAVRERLEAVAYDVDHGQVMLVVERLDDGRADLPCTDDDDLHAAGSLPRSPSARRAATARNVPKAYAVPARTWMPWVARAGSARRRRRAPACRPSRRDRGRRPRRLPCLVTVVRGLATPVFVRRRPASQTASTSSSRTGRSASSRRAAAAERRSSTSARGSSGGRRAGSPRPGVPEGATPGTAPSTSLHGAGRREP